jgi:hypothetical protein
LLAGAHALPRLRPLLAPHLAGDRGGYVAAQLDLLRQIADADRSP